MFELRAELTTLEKKFNEKNEENLKIRTETETYKNSLKQLETIRQSLIKKNENLETQLSEIKRNSVSTTSQQILHEQIVSLKNKVFFRKYGAIALKIVHFIQCLQVK